MNMHTCLMPRPLPRPVRAALAAFLATGAMALAAGSAAAQDITAAEKLLFQTSHLQNVAAPRVLRYRYVRQDAEGAGFATVMIEAPERKSLPALLAPALRAAALARLTCSNT